MANWLSRLFSKRAIESPSVPLTATNISHILGTGANSSSGVAVTPQTALGYPAVWRGVNIRAGTIGRLPLHVLKNTGEGKVKDENHPAYKLLRDQPNPEMSAKAFKMLIESHAILTGNGYAFIRRNAFGQPVDLFPLQPESVIPFRENMRLSYSILADGEMIVENPQNILHVKGLMWDGIVGLGIVDQLKETIGLGLAAQKYQSVFFKNGAAPLTVIELPGALRDKEAVERFRDMWGKRHQGVDNAHAPALLENGASLKPFSVSPEDAALLSTREFEIKQIANIIGIPAHFLGDSTRTSFASLEVEGKNFLRDLADPMSNWEDECRLKLLSPQEKESRSHVIEFNKEAIERPDLLTYVNALSIQLERGILTLNEVREKLNLPSAGEEGDKFRIPLNIGTLGEEDSSQNEEEPDVDDVDEEEDSDALEASRMALSDILESMANRIAADAKSRANKGYEDWFSNIDERHKRIFLEKTYRATQVVDIISNQSNGHEKCARLFFDVVNAEYSKAINQNDQLSIIIEASNSISNKIKGIARSI